MNNTSTRRICALLCVAIVSLLSGCRRRSPRAGDTNNDPRDDPFSAYVNDAARNIVAAARGAPHDPRWDGMNPNGDLRRMDPTGALVLSPLGPQVEVLATAVEIEGIAPGIARLRTTALVFPDGRVRWVEVRIRPGATYETPTDLGMLMTQSPALAGIFARVVETLRGSCALPMATPADMAFFPAEAQGDISRGLAQLPGACVQARAMQVAWLPHFDDVTVFVRGNGLLMRIRSEFETDGGRLHLGSTRVLDVSGSSATPRPTYPPPGYPTPGYPTPGYPPPSYPTPTYPTPPPPPPPAMYGAPTIAFASLASTYRWSDGDWIVRLGVTVTNSTSSAVTFNRSLMTASAGGIPMTAWAPASTLAPIATLMPGQSISGNVSWYYSRTYPQPTSVVVTHGATTRSVPVMFMATAPP